MAYNSDGYIMFDFSDVDFRRTTQTIEGLYDRCVKIIGTNKFILVINANGKTPLPSVCSFVNNQYVIESCIYTFAITSADLIIIKRNDPAGIIDDTTKADNKTWSSNKIDEELNGKQDTLTAGTGISIVDNIISVKDIKTFSYTGDGLNRRHVILPDSAKYILNIAGYSSTYKMSLGSMLDLVNNTDVGFIAIQQQIGVSTILTSGNYSYDSSTNDFYMGSGQPQRCFNELDIEYTIYYI